MRTNTMQAAIKAVPTLIPVMRLIPENTASTGATPKAESRSKATAIPAQTVPRIRIPQLRGLLKGDDCTRPVCTRLCAQGYKASGVEHRGMRVVKCGLAKPWATAVFASVDFLTFP
jgi:hypothetical protein